MLRKCPVDGAYTMQEECPAHPGVETVRPGPAKYSPQDPYGEYRRRLKRLNAQEAEADATDAGA